MLEVYSPGLAPVNASSSYGVLLPSALTSVSSVCGDIVFLISATNYIILTVIPIFKLNKNDIVNFLLRLVEVKIASLMCLLN